jgi:hypothetical protein
MGVGMMLRSACCAGVLLPLLLLAAVDGAIPLAGECEGGIKREEKRGVQTLCD